MIEMRLSVELLLAMGVPGVLARQITSDAELISTDAMRVVQAFITAKPTTVPFEGSNSVEFDGTEWLLVLAGPPGAGKSLAAACALATLGGMWVPAEGLADIKFDAKTARPWPLVVIDNLGLEYAGPGAYGISRAEQLLVHRHSENRRTIVTTNMRRRTLDGVMGFEERYGGRVAERLARGGKYVITLPEGGR
jgi:hypothetical protein